MRSSSDLFFDSRLSRSIVSAAAPVSMVYSAADILSPALRGSISDDCDESTPLISNRIAEISLGGEGVSARQLLKNEVIQAIELLEKIHNMRKTKAIINYFNDFLTCGGFTGRILGGAMGLALLGGIAFFGYSWYRVDHDFDAGFDDKNNKDKTDTLYAFILFCMCLFCLPCMAFLLPVGCIWTNLNDCIKVIKQQNKNLTLDDLTDKAWEELDPVLIKLKIEKADVLTMLVELKKKYPDVLNDILLDTLETIKELENVAINPESVLLGQLTYFAALKQDSRLLISDQKRIHHRDNLDSHQKLDYTKNFTTLFKSTEQSVKSTGAQAVNSSSYLACGDDLNDMIFSYALGRKYSSI